ncbi:hypothetical protein ABPG75_010044 [Micractinium tetrahymenae]
MVRFWNRLQDSMGEPESLLGWALADNLSLMREGGDLAVGSPCWSRRWQQFLQSAPTDSGTLLWLTHLDEAAVLERAAAAYVSHSLEPAQQRQQQATGGETAQRRQQLPAGGEPAQQSAASSQQPAASQPAQPGPNKFAYYLDCIRGDLPLSTPAPHLLEVSNSKHRTALSRFRTSCHDLRIERERYLPPAIKAPPP